MFVIKNILIIEPHYNTFGKKAIVLTAAIKWCFKVLIFIAFVSGEEKSPRFKRRNHLNLRQKNDIFVNTFDYDSFPDEDKTDINHHKIVKKQMGGLLNCGFRAKRSNFKLNPSPFQRIKKSKMTFSRKKFKTKKRESQEPTRNPENMEEHSSRAFCRIPDKTNCHYYFECEMEPDGCIKMVRKRCPGDQTFSLKYRECIHLSYRKGLCREKRQTSCFFKGCKCPEPPPDGDAEPANEWLDAPQGTNQKIPSEFKPRPKLRLRIYHLRCKKSAKEIPVQVRRKRYIPFKAQNIRQNIHRAKVLNQNFHRHQPRSFVVRLNKKPNEQEEGLNEENEVDDEDYEDDDEENEDDADDDRDQSSLTDKNDEEKLNCKEGLKDLFKSTKNAVVNKMKTTDSQFHTRSQMQPEFQSQQFFEKVECETKKSDLPYGDQDKSNKVLIDANIKVDEEISSALKNILSKGMKKKISKKFSEPVIGEISYRNAR